MDVGGGVMHRNEKLVQELYGLTICIVHEGAIAIANPGFSNVDEFKC